MATQHASSGEVIDLRPLGAPLAETQSITLVRDAQLKLMRLVLPAGKELHEHAVDGPITMHCLEGAVDVTTQGSCTTLRGGELMYLAAKVPHALRAVADSSMLVSIVLPKPAT
ncbi:MAG: cupin domain-containing protein [Rhodocyclaceae bacterium]|nr:cupin domain-containing protein [Rhodocyclaceae bacterium]